MLTSLPSCAIPSAVPFPLQQLFISDLVIEDFRIVLSVTWVEETLPRDQRGQGQISFYLWNRTGSAAHPKPT